LFPLLLNRHVIGDTCADDIPNLHKLDGEIALQAFQVVRLSRQPMRRSKLADGYNRQGPRHMNHPGTFIPFIALSPHFGNEIRL
jgi:hypothetical protein